MIRSEILDTQPPASLENERAVLGSILLNTSGAGDVFPILRTHDFYDEANRAVFAQLSEMHRSGVGIDIVTLGHRLQEAGVFDRIGGAAYLGEITRGAPVATHATHYAEIVREVSAKRRLRYLGERLLQESANGKAPEQSIVEAQQTLKEIKAGTSEVGTMLTYRRLTCAELAATEFNTEYLIDWTLVSGQPCIVAGPKKACKTTIVIDLAISLAIAGHFLGRFKVTRGCRVLLMTGESGLATVNETAARISDAAGYNLADIGALIISDQLPVLGNVEHTDALRRMIQGDEIEVLILDPTYLCLNPEGDEASLFAMGAMLRSISELCAEMGVTLILVHHCKKGIADPFAPPELDNIAWAGFQEFARQWLLLGRREKFEPGTGEHKLWLSVGGSAGHSALWAVDINEGAFDGTTPRTWDVSVLKAAEAIQDAQEAAIDRKADAATQKRAAQLEVDRKDVVKWLVKHSAGETKSVLKDFTGIRTARLDAAIASLLADQTIVSCQIKRDNGREYDAFKINETQSQEV